MDYNAFFKDVVEWIQRVNQVAMQHSMESADFWQWVTSSSGELCKKYQDNRIVIKQMVMLIEWLEEVYEKRRG